MVVKRNEFVDHIRQITLDGQIVEADFTGPFATAARHVIRNFAVFTPGLPDTTPLPSDVSVAVSLGRLSRALACTSGHYLEVEVEGEYLLVKSSSCAIRLRTLVSDLVSSRIHDEEAIGKLLALLPREDDGWQNIFNTTAAKISQAIKATRAEHLAVRTGPDGSTVVIGDERDYALGFPLENIKSEKSYTLLLQTTCLRPVLDEIAKADGSIALTGPDGVVGLRAGANMVYMISPDLEVEDTKKAMTTGIARRPAR